jgi:hypothetical protein
MTGRMERPPISGRDGCFSESQTIESLGLFCNKATLRGRSVSADWTDLFKPEYWAS